MGGYDFMIVLWVIFIIVVNNLQRYEPGRMPRASLTESLLCCQPGHAAAVWLQYGEAEVKSDVSGTFLVAPMRS